MSKVAQIPLKVGYIWQYQTADTHLSTITAVSLHIRAVIRELEKRGHQVRIVTFYQNQPHWSDNMIDWQPVEPVAHKKAFRLLESILRGFQSRLHLPYFNLFESYKFAAACQAALSDRDILYERFWILASGGMMISRKLGIPIIYEVNGDIVEEYHQQGLKLSGIQWAAINLVTRYMFNAAGQVIPVSQTLKEKITARYRLQGDNLSVIENGARTDLFTDPNQDEIASVRKLYDLDGCFSIIFVGTFKPWHGIDLLVDAFAKLAITHNNVKLILVGDGPLKPEVEEQISALNLEERVIFTGLMPHQEIPTLLALADLAILNPRATGASVAQSPLKLFEYMAAGKAIIAPRLQNFTQVLTNRITSLLIQPDNAEDLRLALVELIEDEKLRKKLGENAKRQAIDKHSWTRTVSKIDSIMYDLVEKRS